MKMKKAITIYGLIAGVFFSVMTYINYQASLLDFEYGELVGYTTMIVAFSTIFFAVKKSRDEDHGGQIRFGEAFKLGLGIALVASVLYTLTWMVMLQTVLTRWL